ncbi:MAG: phosphotransferase [Oscillospiraceae bacterium]|nr:phosphotransferase [Oscillospiraceae bacterium]
MAERARANEQLIDILQQYYGLQGVSLEFLREGGSDAYLANADGAQYLLKVIGPAFAQTVRQSVAVARYLQQSGFPVPQTVLALNGQAFIEAEIDGETRILVLQQYIADGDEPDMLKCAEEIGVLVGRFHNMMQQYPAQLHSQDKQFFIGRYLDFLHRRQYPRLAEYAALGERLWQKVCCQPKINCHGDLHRGNFLQTPDGHIYLLDFDTVCNAPAMFDVMVLCDMTNYFSLQEEDIAETKAVYQQLLQGYRRCRELSAQQEKSFYTWVALRHFQLQATIVEIHGDNCISDQFIDAQLEWLYGWLQATEG